METARTIVSSTVSRAETVYDAVASTEIYRQLEDIISQLLNFIFTLSIIRTIIRTACYLTQTVFTKLQSSFPYIFYILDLCALVISSISRLFFGSILIPHSKAFRDYEISKTTSPSTTQTKEDIFITLYEYEGCPFCRKVREALCVLGLSYVCYPCPRETLKTGGVCVDSRYRPTVLRKGGKLVFPYLEDSRHGKKMYESDAIIQYLFETYGNSEGKKFSSYSAMLPLPYKAIQGSMLNSYSLALGKFTRPCMDMGFLRIPSKPAAKQLHLYGYESAALCKKVREKLSSLELQHTMHCTTYPDIYENLLPFATFNDEKCNTIARNAYCKLFRAFVEFNGNVHANLDKELVIIATDKDAAKKNTTKSDQDISSVLMATFQQAVKEPKEIASKYGSTFVNVAISQFLEMPILIDPNVVSDTPQIKNVFLGANEIIKHITNKYQNGTVPAETWLDLPGF